MKICLKVGDSAPPNTPKSHSAEDARATRCAQTGSGPWQAGLDFHLTCTLGSRSEVTTGRAALAVASVPSAASVCLLSLLRSHKRPAAALSNASI